jgi:hypothetical protein
MQCTYIDVMYMHRFKKIFEESFSKVFAPLSVVKTRKNVFSFKDEESIGCLTEMPCLSNFTSITK